MTGSEEEETELLADSSTKDANGFVERYDLDEELNPFRDIET